MNLYRSLATAPKTQLGRAAMIHVTYRRLAQGHIRNGGQITPDVHKELWLEACQRVPLLQLVKKSRPTYSYFHPYMALEATKTGVIDFPAMPMAANLDTTQSPQIEAVLEELAIAKPELLDEAAQPQRDSEPTYILVREKVNLSAPAGDWLLLERTTFDALRVGDVIVYVSEVVDFRTSKPLPPNTKREPVRTIGDYKMIGDSKRKHINGSVPLADAPVWRLAIPPTLTDANYGVIAA